MGWLRPPFEIEEKYRNYGEFDSRQYRNFSCERPRSLLKKGKRKKRRIGLFSKRKKKDWASTQNRSTFPVVSPVSVAFSSTGVVGRRDRLGFIHRAIRRRRRHTDQRHCASLAPVASSSNARSRRSCIPSASLSGSRPIEATR